MSSRISIGNQGKPYKGKSDITLRNDGDYTLIVEYCGREVIREFFSSGESEIYHSVNLEIHTDTDERAEMQAAIVELREGAAALLLLNDPDPLKLALNNTKKWSA